MRSYMKTSDESMLPGFEEWISSAEGSPARTSRRLATEQASMDPGQNSGSNTLGSSENYSPDGSSSKTSRTAHGSGCASSEMDCTNLDIEREPWGLPPEIWERPTCVAASSLLPTPTADPYGTSNDGSPHDSRKEYRTKGKASLWTLAKNGLLPTPVASDGKMGGRDLRNRKNGPTLPQAVGGPLNPRWTLWLMGFPTDWFNIEPLETPLFRSARGSQGK